MNAEEFKKNAHMIVDWIAEYFEQIEKYPVKSQAAPGDILKRLPRAIPIRGEKFERIFSDFEKIIMPGITHWQSPNFFAYFPANNSFASILGEMLTAALGAQCMSWATSPAAAELEESVMGLLAGLIGLPEGFCGVIEDTASTSTLCAVLSAREKHSDYSINADGFAKKAVFTAYCSREAHSSIEKAVKIAGIGKNNLRLVACDKNYAMDPQALNAAIEKDVRAGLRPLFCAAALGTTGSTAIDPIRAIGNICKKYGVWLHIDAAYAGSALILPEMRHLADGVELADSFVFNPHKWLFTNFDCSAYFVKDKGALIRTFEILPEYLKTGEKSPVNNYRDWGIQLGRRFRALKLWFVLRSFGASGLQKLVRKHIDLARYFAGAISAERGFEIMAPRPLSVVCFRYRPQAARGDDSKTDRFNELLLEKLNATGKLYMTHTRLGGKFVIRMAIGQTRTEKRHVKAAIGMIVKMAREMEMTAG